ncbi:hypothetical protein AMK34_21725 [Amycolatopsis sp. CB00013]|nr:hypothetical protein AMK34_21725 [Amycolatopsis sp. CB00013]
MTSVSVDLPVVMAGVALYEHIRRNLDPSGRLPAEVGLPDDARVMSDRLRWVPGAMDGVIGHHGSADGTDRATEVARLLAMACRRPSARQLRKLYAGVMDDDVMDYVDALMERLGRERLDGRALHRVGKWLAVTAPDRGPVKLGIALLGVTGLGDDVAVVRTLGAHEEFTLFCAVAISNGLPAPESELWALAASVDGWGRIHCVERLRDTTDPDIRSWILREGFRNSIMYEYLAYIAATTGGLLEALRGETVDRGLLTSAGEILEALITGGPAEDVDDYESGADAVEAFLATMTTQAQTLQDFSTVATIRSFLARETGWDQRSQNGWTATRRQAFEHASDQILSQDSWIGRITAGLASDDPVEFSLADRAARVRGMDTFDAHLEKIKTDPFGSGWFHAWQQADTGRAQQLADLAHTLLPIDQITTGPADELGMGPQWRAHNALDWTLQALRDHPGTGADLLLAGLHSPVTRNRNMALTAFQQWPRTAWPADARDVIHDLARSDPNDNARRFALELTTGQIEEDEQHDR